MTDPRAGRRAMRKAAHAVLPLLLAGCGALSNLSEVGRPPEMSSITDPTQGATYRPISLPMPPAEPPPPIESSLWRPGARSFFKDQRAAHVGDLITVLVNITDNANLDNQSAAARTDNTAMGIPGLFGLQNQLGHILTGPIDPTSLVNVTGGQTVGGTGKIKRDEAITLRIAGVITQVLANGNMVVTAKQELRVNSELRELTVSGVIRPPGHPERQHGAARPAGGGAHFLRRTGAADERADAAAWAADPGRAAAVLASESRSNPARRRARTAECPLDCACCPSPAWHERSDRVRALFP